MTTIGNESRPAYVYDADTDTWVPIGFGPHTHDEYIDKTIITTKGDIIVGTATEAVERLGVGAEGSVLIADPTSTTGLAWGEAGGSITVSTTAPEEPGEGDLWFNSTNATTYIYYDGFWVEQSPAIAGPKGEPGIVASASEPSDTDVIWLDTDEEPDVPVPAGGTTGQVLIKSSSDDYDTDWVNPPSGNAIINGAFDIWQRGTSFTQVGTSDIYSADRWQLDIGGDAAGSLTCSRQTFTPAELAITGFGEGQFYARLTQNVVGASTRFNIKQKIEDVRTLAGQTVTLSFWAKANNAFTLLTSFDQDFGSGGSTTVSTTGPSFSITTSWQRFSGTISLPSISGKTVGTSSLLQLYFNFPPDTAGDTFDIWGVQLEAGPVATPFRRNANSLQGELAACQRYYYRSTAGNTYGSYGLGLAYSTTAATIGISLPVTMRVNPTSVDFGNLRFTDMVSGFSFTNLVFSSGNITSQSYVSVDGTGASGLTQFRPLFLTNNNNTAGFIGFSAEL
jgi:hypothetical protein